MKIKIYILCMLACLSMPALGKKVYKIIDEKGNVFYSDAPKEGSKEIILPKVQTYKSQPLPKEENKTENYQNTYNKAVDNYQMVFSTPQNEQVFTVDQNEIELKVFLEPELHSNDRVKFYLDNKPVSELQQDLHFTLKNINRGSHEIIAKVYPKTGMGEAKGVAGPIKIHVQRAIVNKSSPFRAP